MSYVRKILRPGEQIIVTGKLHWIIYLPAIVLVLLSFVVFGLGFHEDPKTETIASVFAFVAAAIGVVLGIMAWFKQCDYQSLTPRHLQPQRRGRALARPYHPRQRRSYRRFAASTARSALLARRITMLCWRHLSG